MNRELAISAEEEIAEIKRKHLSIYNAARQSLSTAIEIGEWFIGQHEKIEHGGWLSWLRENFPEISDDSVRNYIRLAQNREFLVANLQIPNARNFEGASIREALKQIDILKKKRPIKEPDLESDDDVEFPFDEHARRTRHR